MKPLNFRGRTNIQELKITEGNVLNVSATVGPSHESFIVLILV